MWKVGSTNIGKSFYGSTEIAKAYLGSTLVWQKQHGPEVPYQQVAYLRNTTLGDYVDTGITADSNTRVVVWARNFNIGCGILFGSRVGETSNTMILTLPRMTSNGGRIRFDFGTGNNNVDWGTKNIGWYHKYEIDGNVFKVDDATIYTAPESTWSNSVSIHLFGGNGNGSHIDPLLPMDIAACQIYKSGTLVRDMVAVRDGQVGKMYDKVSKTLFGNEGSGSFGVGPDGTMEDLLTGYTQKTYVYCAGNSYIDSGIKGSNTLSYTGIFMPTGSESGAWLLGCQTTSSSKRYGLGFGQQYANFYHRYNTQSITLAVADAVNSICGVYKENNVCYAYKNYSQVKSGTATSATFTTDYNVHVGAGISGGTVSTKYTGRIYYVSLGNQRNFIPVVNSSNVVGLYDTYNDSFYPSITDAFSSD